jgi:hypothetical protein
MEDELARRLEINTAALLETVQEARELRSQARESVAFQKEALWQVQQQRDQLRHGIRQAGAQLCSELAESSR